MRRSDLFVKAAAVCMASMMVFTIMPVNAFAECVGDDCKTELLPADEGEEKASFADVVNEQAPAAEAAAVTETVNEDEVEKTVKKKAPKTGEESFELSEESTAEAYDVFLDEERTPTDYKKAGEDFSKYFINVQDVRGAKYNKVFDGGSGKPTLLVFGGIGSCGICHSDVTNLLSILDDQPDSFDIFYFDVKNNKTSTMVSELNDLDLQKRLCCGQIPDAKIRGYDTTPLTAYETELKTLIYHSYYVGLDQNNYTMPFIIYLDKNGQFVDSSTDYMTVSEFQTILKKCGAGTTKQKTDLVNVQKVTAFVERLYTVLLDRASDKNGLDDWVNKLATGEKNGVDVADGFVFSPEFLNKNYDDETFVEKLYLTFMNRASDADGKKNWVKKLKQGYSRKYVAAGFINSTEFKNICKEYGIESGKLEASDERSDKNLYADREKVAAYVDSLYANILKRDADADGKKDWINRICNHQETAAEVARIGFFTSKEYQNKNTTNEQFLTDLYAAFFNREPDSKGYNYWLKRMKDGYTRDQVILEGFGESAEFTAILRSYGLRYED